jgi:hypothetical protein
MRAILGVLTMAAALAAYGGEAAAASTVKLIAVGNEAETGGWCDRITKSVAAGSSLMVDFKGSTESGTATATGKYRMVAVTGFSLESRSVAFTSTPVTTKLRVSVAGTVTANTYTLPFVAIDAQDGQSPQKTCKIQVIVPTVGLNGSPASNQPPASDGHRFTASLQGAYQDSTTRKFFSFKVLRKNADNSYTTVAESGDVEGNTGATTYTWKRDPLAAATYLVQVRVTVKDSGGSNTLTTAEKNLEYVVAGGGPVIPANYFTTDLYPFYKDARCVNCHGTVNAASGANHGGGAQTGSCTTCHKKADGTGDTDWRQAGAPSFSAGGTAAQPTAQTASQICGTVKTSSQAANIDSWRQHVRAANGDPRIAWAFSPTRVVGSETARPATPGGYANFESKSIIWFNGGKPCPQ